ncbi:MAG: chitobiase/beta-hexosaminidase C-terminal domain-containing protein, partial [Spirochaetales bacterium]|nr:chitobiase/beta-hexosaminidase C-terminal domain-containing protein [Spirochaetales bacterium]
MKKTIDLIKMFLCFAVLAAMSVGCSNTAILSGTDTASIETQSYDYDADDGYVSVKLQLPENVGRGWNDIASYNVTATRGDDVEEFTSPTPSMSVRLKVGTWYFSANAKDEYGNILYSAASSATIGLKSSQVYIGLLKRVGQVKVSMNIDNIISGVAKPQRYEVKADRGQGFAPVIGEVNNIEDTVTLSGLAQGEWTLTCTAYSVPSSDPTAQATVPYYQGTSTVYVEASQTKSVSVALDALKVAPPTFSHSGEVKANTEVTISSQQSGVKIYVTTDGKDPSTGASDKAPACPYVLTISKATTVKAAAYIAGIGFSEVVTKEFTVVAADKCVAPQISPESQTIVGTGYCSITCDEVGAAIYYTTDGTTPTTDSTLYVDKIEINKSMTVKAIAVKAGLTNSDVVSAAYTYQKQKCAAPTIDPLSGTFAPGQIIRISQNTAGSTTYYLISDDKNDSASAEDDNTKSFTNDGFDIDTSKYNAGTYYIIAFSRIAGREDSDITKATIIIKPANNDDNVIYMCIDNLIVTTQETNLYKEVGTMPTNSVVWYGFTYDAGGSVYIDVEPSTVRAQLFKNGQKDDAELTVVNNVATLSGENYYYLKLTAESLSSNVKVRVYSTTSPEI